MADVFSRETIEREYRRLGYDLGWRFLYSSERTLDTASLLVMGLNPGGDRNEPDHPDWSCETGSAYVVERWLDKGRICLPGQSPLQAQVQQMLRLANVKPDEVLAGNFVPFRSRSWNELQHKSEAIAFGERLWSWALGKSSVTRVVVLGQSSGGLQNRIAGLVGAKWVSSLPTGWGDYAANVFVAPTRKIVVSLPHLSRFKIFGRGNFDDRFRSVMDWT